MRSLLLTFIFVLQAASGFAPTTAPKRNSSTRTSELNAVTRFDIVHRRTFFTQTVACLSLATTLVIPFSAQASSSSSSADDFVNDLKTSKSKLEAIPQLLDQNEWDKVRTILKTPPVNLLWNLGDAKNPLVQYAKESGDFELLEMKDELSVTLQMCDQLTYDNAFVYFQPGNGKINIKEPKQLAAKAMSQIQQAIDLVVK